MPRCSVCDDGAALLCGACVDAELAASRARLAQARRAEADWKAQAEAAPLRPAEVDADAVAASLAKTLLAVARRVHADRAQLRTARAANDAAASSALARGVVHALGHVAFFAPDLGFDVVLGARGDALAAHEVAALCERAVALGEGANDATAVLAHVKNLTRPAPSPSQSQ